MKGSRIRKAVPPAAASELVLGLLTIKVSSYCGRLLQKTLSIFVFADLTPDDFHFWMSLSPRTSEPVRHVPVPPLEQNSGDAIVTKYYVSVNGSRL